MDTDPNVAGDVLWIAAVSNVPLSTVVRFEPASTRRYYSLLRSDEVTSTSWVSVAGQTGIAGAGGVQELADTNAAARAFYRVGVTVAP
jgi:hypothetical protein